MLHLSDLTTLDEFRKVEELEGLIWGRVDLVPVVILAVSVRRGAVLVGAWDDDQLVGFVYSFPALRRGEAGASHWSHMLGVHPDQRGPGLGRALKLAQRERVLALGLDLIEWTFDPLQAANAHLNFVKLGVVVEQYEEKRLRRVAQPAAWWPAHGSVRLSVVDPPAARRTAPRLFRP
jgi:predicted GNAT superfamily acetyltransferase